jgi:hypothetical protein
MATKFNLVPSSLSSPAVAAKLNPTASLIPATIGGRKMSQEPGPWQRPQEPPDRTGGHSLPVPSGSQSLPPVFRFG